MNHKIMRYCTYTVLSICAPCATVSQYHSTKRYSAVYVGVVAIVVHVYITTIEKQHVNRSSTGILGSMRD